MNNFDEKSTPYFAMIDEEDIDKMRRSICESLKERYKIDETKYLKLVNKLIFKLKNHKEDDDSIFFDSNKQTLTIIENTTETYDSEKLAYMLREKTGFRKVNILNLYQKINISFYF